jgi:uncharacterized protein
MVRTLRCLSGCLFGLTLVLCALPALAADPSFPELTGRVVDDAGLLSGTDKAQLEADLKALEDKSSDQVVVVTVPSLQGYPVEEYGYRLGRHWGIGTAKLNNGVLLIVAPNERKVRIEVGRGLEPILTDALSKIIIENGILPNFRTGDYAAGIKDGVRDITLALTGDAAELEERAKARPDADDPAIDWIMVIFWTIIILYFIWVLWQSTRPPGIRGRRSGPVFVPGPGWDSGRDSWSSGGGGFSGGGGGGFSGGGGSFGGGGASGGW